MGNYIDFEVHMSNRKTVIYEVTEHRKESKRWHVVVASGAGVFSIFLQRQEVSSLSSAGNGKEQIRLVVGQHKFETTAPLHLKGEK
ncbi:hypothetical protein TNCV_1595051 [Trichonephila clavipes]|nr:hypothetical protein TNCV_1595051 [Trichonephila clavipes]